MRRHNGEDVPASFRFPLGFLCLFKFLRLPWDILDFHKFHPFSPQPRLRLHHNGCSALWLLLQIHPIVCTRIKPHFPLMSDSQGDAFEERTFVMFDHYACFSVRLDPHSPFAPCPFRKYSPPLSPSLRSSQCPDENIVELARGTLIGIRALLPLLLPLLLNP